MATYDCDKFSNLTFTDACPSTFSKTTNVTRLIVTTKRKKEKENGKKRKIRAREIGQEAIQSSGKERSEGRRLSVSKP